MTKAGAQHSRDLKQLAEDQRDRNYQLAINDMQIRLDCHQRAVSATTEFRKDTEGVESSIPAPTGAQMAYAQELYEWATEKLGDL